ncbi:AraC family transcriptional regulator [Vibrio algivorus]|uniref:AraC family transcriptional regulator n=1 Tax=Vibrio algivorus TaxID=1667024 RepID=A0A557P8R6_9VIBR|nr:AraC family transcriptional regulator [Vibrio algivorus]TVO37053.1 AraC family transcriptional regulator [Vibrio algivorus]GLT14540.1 hypothetical protein GCM10007931_15150 [Vibrio algivorus]
MNYLIAHHIHQYPFLHTTARKKTIKHKLISVLSGFASVRLGKTEYVMNAGDTFWLPFDCLNALTYFPNCSLIEVEVSVRSTKNYPHQAGLVQRSALLNVLLETLSQSSFDPSNNEQKKWLEIVGFELEKLSPQLDDSVLTLDNAAKIPSIDQASLQMALKVRQAFKLRASGIKTERIIDEVFSANAQQAEQLCLAIANKSLST